MDGDGDANCPAPIADAGGVDPNAASPAGGTQLQPEERNGNVNMIIGHPGADDWQEELYQMIKSLNDKYFVALNVLYNKISIKIQHIDNHMPAQISAEQYEMMKRFKAMLECILHFLQVNKSSIQLGFREKIPIYERQILMILSSQRRQAVAQQTGRHTYQKPQASLPSSSSKGKKQKKLRCHFCRKVGHFKKDCLKRKIWFKTKGVPSDPTHEQTKAHGSKNEGHVFKE